MGDSPDFFEDLRTREATKSQVSSPMAEPSAAPAHDSSDLEAPLLHEDNQHPNQRPQQQDHNQGIQEQTPPTPPPVLEPLPVSEYDPLIYICQVLSVVTAVGALLCLLVNAISLFRSFDYRGFDYRVSVRRFHCLLGVKLGF